MTGLERRHRCQASAGVPPYRGYAGQIASGVFKPGDEVVVLPSGRESRIKRIDTYEGPLGQAATYTTDFGRN